MRLLQISFCCVTTCVEVLISAVSKDLEILWLKKKKQASFSPTLWSGFNDSPGLIYYSASTRDFRLGSTCWHLPGSRKGGKKSEGQAFLPMDVARKFSTSPVAQDLSCGHTSPQGKLGGIVCREAVMFLAVISEVVLLKQKGVNEFWWTSCHSYTSLSSAHPFVFSLQRASLCRLWSTSYGTKPVGSV